MVWRCKKVYKDEMGKRYDPWLVIEKCPINYRPKNTSMTRWKCKCVHCGAQKIYIGNTLRFGNYASVCKECGGQ